MKLRCKRSVLKAVSLSKSQLQVQEPSAYADLLDQRREEEAAVVGAGSTIRRGTKCMFFVFFFALGLGGVGGGVGMMTFLHLHTWSMLRKSWAGVGGGDDDVPCTCTHGQCYPSHGLGWGVGMTTFLALAHTVNATQVMGWLG